MIAALIISGHTQRTGQTQCDITTIQGALKTADALVLEAERTFPEFEQQWGKARKLVQDKLHAQLRVER